MTLWSVSGVPKPLEEVVDPKILNAWLEPDATQFKVRSEKYLTTKQKVHSKESMYKCVGMNVFKRGTGMFPATQKIKHLEAFLKQHPQTDLATTFPRFLVISWQFHNFFRTEYWCAVQLFEIKQDLVDDSQAYRTLNRFLESSDAEKNTKLKFMASIKEASSAIKQSVSMLGGERPAIIGKKLTTAYSSGSNFLEIDLDVGSSHIASSLNGVISRASQSLVVDKAWFIEGQSEDELPERILCTCEWFHCGVDDCSIEIDKKGYLKGVDKKEMLRQREKDPIQEPKRDSQAHPEEEKRQNVMNESFETADIEAFESDVDEDEEESGEEDKQQRLERSPSLENSEDELFDTFATLNDEDFLPPNATPRMKKEAASRLSSLGEKFTFSDLAQQPLEGYYSGHMELKSYDPGLHRWHKRHFSLTWSCNEMPKLSYTKEKDAFTHSLSLKPNYRIESRSTLFGGSYVFALIEDTEKGPETRALLRCKSSDELHSWLVHLVAAITCKERCISKRSEDSDSSTKIDSSMIDPNLLDKRRSRRSSLKQALTDWLPGKRH